MTEAARETTTPAEGERSGPVTLVEALERLLPSSNGNPFKVAARLNRHHQQRDISLLGDGVPMAPNSNPGTLGIMARNLADGKAELYIEPRGSVGWNRHYQDWTFERASFEAHFPSAPENMLDRRGRQEEYSVVDLLTEALVYVGARGLPDTMTGDGSLHDKLKQQIGSRCPERSRFSEIFGPIYQRIKSERPR